jgi:hypothetical protein
MNLKATHTYNFVLFSHVLFPPPPNTFETADLLELVLLVLLI